MLGLTHWKQSELAKDSMAHGPAAALDLSLLLDQVWRGLAVTAEDSEREQP